MALITALLGGLSAASSLFGQHKAKEQLKEQRKLLEQQKRESNQLYTERAYSDPTQRASARYVLSKAQELYKDRNRASEGKRAVVGGTEDSTTASKQAGAEGIASATAQVAASADARADRAAQQHSAEQQSIAQQQGTLAQQSAEQTSAATKELTQTAATVADAIEMTRASKDDARDDDSTTRSTTTSKQADADSDYIDTPAAHPAGRGINSIFDDAALAANTISLPSSNA